MYIDLDVTTKALGLAGLRTVTVGEFIGERTAASPVLGGMNMDGKPILATITFKSVDLAQIGYASTDADKRHAIIQINHNEAGSRMADELRGGYDLVDAWTNITNMAVLAGLRSAALGRYKNKSLPDRPGTIDIVRLFAVRRLLSKYSEDTGPDLSDPTSYLAR